MKFLLKYPLPLINGLRRSLISYVKSFSLNTIIIENETDYNDDILKLRISMIPVHKCEKISFKKRNDTHHNIIITSSELCTDNCIMKDIFLFNLKPGQSIEFECEIEEGFGFQHSRWQVIQTPIMKLIENVVFKKYDIEMVKTITPELILENKLNKHKCLIDKTSVNKLNEIEKIVEFKNSGEYELSFIADFYDETYCLTQAFIYLKNLFENIQDHEIIYHEQLHIYKFYNQSFTYGTILQYYLQKEGFAAFSKPHYLDNFIIVKFDKKIDLESICKKIVHDIEQMEKTCFNKN
jgi:DNA-directed RNA polymerase alpha subunit